MNTRRVFLKSLGTLGLGSIGYSSIFGEENPHVLPKEHDQTMNNTYYNNEELFWTLLRQQFQMPKEYAYFNTGTVGISPIQVISAVSNSLNSNEVYGVYGGEEEARERLSKFVNVSIDNLCLTHSTTEGINIIIDGLPLKYGDEVIISDQEHASHALPWIKVMQRVGIKLRIFQPKNTAKENIEVISNLINRKTKVIAIPHISCTIGTVYPIKEICQIARKNNIYTLIDGAHATGMIKLDISDLECDFYASCCHKWLLGSKGTGFLYIRDELLEIIKPSFIGADAAIKWNLSTEGVLFDGFKNNATRYEYGLKNVALWKGVVAAIDLFESLGMERIQHHNEELTSYLLDNLQQFPDKYEVLSSSERVSYSGIIGYRPRVTSHSEYAMIAKKENIRVRVVNESNLNSIRISAHIYNNKHEIDRLLNLF